MKNKAFTLIEILVVITIIALLASVVFVFVGDARARARNAKRKLDLDTIRKALEMYYLDHDHYPPDTLYGDTSAGINPSGMTPPNPPEDDWGADSDLRVLVEEGYLSRLPIDPINNSEYYYRFEPNKIGEGDPPCQINSCSWCLTAILELDENPYYLYSLCKK